MARIDDKRTYSNFSTGLNVVDSAHDMADSDLTIATNVIYRPTGEAESINGHLQVGNQIYVNSILATKVLGGKKFNSTIYLMASNGTEARLVKKATFTGSITVFANAGGGLVTVTSASHGLRNGDSVTISGTTSYNGTFTISSVATNTFNITDTFVANDATGTWTSVGWSQVSSQNFSATALVQFEDYNSKLWFVNGLTTNSNVLHFLDTSDVLTGIGTSSGLVSGINRICLHQERIWISYLNTLYVSIQYPTGVAADWDASRVYSGSDMPGYIIIDNRPSDRIRYLISHFGSLVIFRELSIHVITGATILTSTIQKSFNSRGMIADLSVGRADTNLYFLSIDGVKQFSGISTKDQETQFDTISTISTDRKIRDNITAFSDQSLAVGYSFKDKYYLSDSTSVIYVFDEITNGWSQWDQMGAEVFIEDGNSLYFAKGAKYYQVNSDTSASLTSHIKTKDFNLGTDDFYKCIEKLTAIFKRKPSANTVVLEWYLNGSNIASGTKTLTIQGSSLKWDAMYAWDSGIQWDSQSLNSFSDKERKLKSCLTIAFGVKATGTNRFSLSTLNIIFEKLRKES